MGEVGDFSIFLLQSCLRIFVVEMVLQTLGQNDLVSVGSLSHWVDEVRGIAVAALVLPSAWLLRLLVLVSLGRLGCGPWRLNVCDIASDVASDIEVEDRRRIGLKLVLLAILVLVHRLVIYVLFI